MKRAVKEMSQELARDLSEEVKAIKVKLETEKLSQSLRDYLTESRKELNKQRIKALGFTLIQGGKDV
jgi:hypothetical protein